ncbi:MAG: hypothetical protein B6D59_02490 [Campylobacteraceae bacterium 4484_4]|nr:MAG: hypothetical protein B6D59_02490 [Campylobacteraceae bacterium 4484_4]
MRFLWILFAFVTLHSSLFAFVITSETKILITQKSEPMQKAAQELHKYLSKITGRSLPPVSSDTLEKRGIVFLRRDTPFAQHLPFAEKLSSLKEDGFMIVSTPEYLYLTATNDRALFYALYRLLEKYAKCRFLSADYETVPKHFRLDLGTFEEKREPRFEYRELFFQESDDPVFARKMGLNGRLGHRIEKNPMHLDIDAFNRFSPFALFGPERSCGGQIDFSDPAIRKEAARRIEEIAAGLPVKEGDLFLLEHEDIDSYCTKGIPKGESPSFAFAGYGRYIATRIDPRYRKNPLLLQAYQWSLKPPRKVEKFPENLGVIFSPIGMDFARSIDEKPNRRYFDALLGWRAFSENLYIWHYGINFAGYLQPYPDLYALDHDIKRFSQIPQIKGLFIQGDYESFGADLADLRVWVFAKLLWDPSHDIDELIKTFCKAYYGPASDEVVDYIRYLHRYLKETKEALLVKTSADMRYLDPQFLDFAESLLQKGLQKTSKDSPFYEHTLSLFAGIDYIRLLKAPAGEKRARSIKRLMAFLDRRNVTHFAEGASTQILRQLARVPEKKAPPPPQAKGLAKGVDWLEFQEYALQLCCAEIVADAAAGNGRSAKMPGNISEWGFQLSTLNLPKGVWDVYADVKITLKPKTSLLKKAKFALFYGIYPQSKGGMLIAQFTPGRYRSIKIGTLDTNTQTKAIWLRPPENESVEGVYLDRIYLIRKKYLPGV